MIVQIVRFKSRMTKEEVRKMYEDRSPRYRALPGLIQKYYLHFPESEEHGAVYVWESEKDMEKFRNSDLSQTIPTAYQVQGSPDVRLADIVMTLRPVNAE